MKPSFLFLKRILKTVIVLGVGSLTLKAELSWEKEDLTLTVKPDQSVARGSYPFQNTGQKPIRITSVTTSCPCCTEAVASKEIIAPGEKGIIQIIFHVDKMSPAMEKKVFVKTDDGSPAKSLPLTVHIEESIRFTPRSLTWGSNELRKAKTVEAQLMEGEAISDLQVKSSSEAIKVESHPSKTKGIYRITVTPSSGITPVTAWVSVHAKLKSGKTTSAMLFASAQ